MCVCVREREGGYTHVHVYTHVQVQCHIKLKLFVPATSGTSLRIFLCCYSPLSLSPCWGCGSARPTGRGFRSGWLSGSSLSTVFLVTRSIAMCCPLYPLLQSMQVHVHIPVCVHICIIHVHVFIVCYFLSIQMKTCLSILVLLLIGYYISNLLIKYKNRCKL